MDSNIYISADYSREHAAQFKSSTMQVPTHRMSETMTEICRRRSSLSVSRMLYIVKESPTITVKHMLENQYVMNMTSLLW